MSIQTPFVTPFVSIRDFGAIPNDPSVTARLANTEAFKKAQAAMQSPGEIWGHPLFVPSGTFYLADDLHIKKAIELFGTGMQGESILKFPAGTSLIIDPATNADPEAGGTHSVIRDIQIISEGNWSYGDEESPFDPRGFEPPTFEGTSNGTPAIKMHAPANIQRVLIQYFTGTGIYIFAGEASNANQWRIHDVSIFTCGGHGIHVDGGEAQGGLCTGVKMISIGGSGIIDSAGGGNTYVGCYAEVVKGRGYASDSASQTTFVGCFSEAKQRIRLTVGGHVWIGGSFGPGFTDDTTAFIVENYANVHPFEVPNLKDSTIRFLVGYPNDGTDPTTVCAWANSNNEFHVMRWDMDNKIWAIENGVGGVDYELNLDETYKLTPDGTRIFKKLRPLGNRNIASYLTGTGHPRGPWLQGFGEMLLGPANEPIKISRGDRPDDGTGEPGDIVYAANLDVHDPDVDNYIGYVCIGPARKWKPFGKIEA